MNVECTVAKIKDQLQQLSESLESCDLLHQLETARSKRKGCSYRVRVKNMLTTMRNRIKKRSSKTGRKKRKDSRNKANGGTGRKTHKDSRNKANGGAGRKDRRNVIRGGPGRPRKKTWSVNPTEPQSPTGTSQCNELRDFWWNHSSDAAVLASCCASHEAAMHTFWSVEEWMEHIASATTGIHTNLSKI